LRHLTIKTKAAVVVPSAMMKEEKSRSFNDAADAAPAAPAAEAAPAA
jgi:small subunit ribosomal protein S6